MASSGEPSRGEKPTVQEELLNLEEGLEREISKSLEYIRKAHKETSPNTMEMIEKLHSRKYHPDDFNPEYQGCLSWIRHFRRTLYIKKGRKRLVILEFLESARFELFLLGLVGLDVLMVSIEAVVDIVFTFSHDEGHRRLLDNGSGTTCDADLAQSIAGTCRIISLVILFTFVLEIGTKAIIAPKAFAKHAGHIIDLVVVLASIIFEFTLHHSSGGLLIFFRCWRLVRIGHGFYEQAEHVIKVLEVELQLEHTMAYLQKYEQFTKRVNLNEEYHIYSKSGSKALEEYMQSQNPTKDLRMEPARGKEEAQEAATVASQTLAGAGEKNFNDKAEIIEV